MVLLPIHKPLASRKPTSSSYQERALAPVITHLSVYTLRNLALAKREKLGCVVFVMRRWPRGVRHCYAGRSIVDYWLKEAGTSLALLQAYQHGDQQGHILSWEAFVERYHQEPHEQTTFTPIAYQIDTGEQMGSPVSIATSSAGFLAELERRFGAICCVRHEDLTRPGSHCHRTELVSLVRDFQAGSEKKGEESSRE